VQPIRTKVRTNHRPTLIKKGGHSSTPIKETTAPIKTQTKHKQNKTKQNKTKQNNITSHMTYHKITQLKHHKQQPKRPKFENIHGQEY
jgi:5-methylcytosine-specific restriction endonuclease McrA